MVGISIGTRRLLPPCLFVVTTTIDYCDISELAVLHTTPYHNGHLELWAIYISLLNVFASTDSTLDANNYRY